MSTVGVGDMTDSIVNAQIGEDGYLFINDKINFFTGDMEVNGVRQRFVLGIPVR